MYIVAAWSPSLQAEDVRTSARRSRGNNAPYPCG